MIVKVQTSLNTDDVLIYNQKRDIMWQGLSTSVRNILQKAGKNKAYFKAKIDSKGVIGLIKMVKDKEW